MICAQRAVRRDKQKASMAVLLNNVLYSYILHVKHCELYQRQTLKIGQAEDGTGLN